MWKNLKEYASKSATPASDRGQDLTSILDRSQRADLTVLVAEIIERMRSTIENFHDPVPQSRDSSSGQSPHDKDTETTPPSEIQKEETSNNLDKRSTVKVPSKHRKSVAIALADFDVWRDSVLLRICEVVNKDQENEDREINDPSSQYALESQNPLLNQDDASLNKLREVYHPVETTLSQLPEAKRLLILHSLLLLLLSLEHYNARSRVLMLYLSSSLGLDVKLLNGDEVKVARALLDTALALSSNAEAQGQDKSRVSYRNLKVGIASVAGATLIGLTGGLAAPLVAAGLGSILGGLGIGATAVAGYLGAVAGSAVVVGGIFGAYGGRMTGRMVDRYAREVDDFAFLPLRGSQQSPKDEKEAAQEDHRLRVTICVTGWVTEEDNFVEPWRVIGADSEVFGLRWELGPLKNLGNAMDLLVTSAAWTAGEQVLKRTVLSHLLSAVVLPLSLLKIARIAENPFSVAMTRADKAGEVLADALISKVQGERSVTLIGYSLGSRVIFSCLQSLAKRGAYGLVESAILMGSPTPSSTQHWRRMRSVVSGRLVNVFSENDAVLALLYRTSSLQLGVAGLEPIEGLKGVENFDASDIISGHLRYQFLIGKILGIVGLESIDTRELAREEAALRTKNRRQEQERKRNEEQAEAEEDSKLGHEPPSQPESRPALPPRRPSNHITLIDNDPDPRLPPRLPSRDGGSRAS